MKVFIWFYAHVSSKKINFKFLLPSIWIFLIIIHFILAENIFLGHFPLLREGKICILKFSRSIREQSRFRFFFFSLLFSLLALFCPYTWELHVNPKINHLCLIKSTKENKLLQHFFSNCLITKLQYHIYLKEKPCTHLAS